MDNIVNIPTNFTDAGRILGIFETRHVIEAAVVTLPAAAAILLVSPFNLTATIIGGAIVIVPLCGFALMGIQDYSLFTFIGIYSCWLLRRRILTYRGVKDEPTKYKKRAFREKDIIRKKPRRSRKHESKKPLA